MKDTVKPRLTDAYGVPLQPGDFIYFAAKGSCLCTGVILYTRPDKGTIYVVSHSTTQLRNYAVPRNAPQWREGLPTEQELQQQMEVGDPGFLSYSTYFSPWECIKTQVTHLPAQLAHHLETAAAKWRATHKDKV
jgi:hypothetical protein